MLRCPLRQSTILALRYGPRSTSLSFFSCAVKLLVVEERPASEPAWLEGCGNPLPGRAPLEASGLSPCRGVVVQRSLAAG